MREKEKAYLVRDYGTEPFRNCGGRVLREDGTEIGRHHSSSFSYLRLDLTSKLDDPSKYEIVDLIEQGMEKAPVHLLPVTVEELVGEIKQSMYIDDISAMLIANRILSKFDIRRKP